MLILLSCSTELQVINPCLPFRSYLPAVDDLSRGGNGAKVAHASTTSSPKCRGRERSEASPSQAAHGRHVTHVTHAAHGAERTEACDKVERVSFRFPCRFQALLAVHHRLHHCP